MNIFTVGSTYFFKDIKGFKSKDTDKVLLVDNPVGFTNCRQTTRTGSCLFEWRRMSADEFVKITLETKLSMTVGKFLVKEFCNEIGFTINHLKQLESIFDKLDEKHKYEKVIYNAYINNNSFTLTDEQRKEAYNIYKKSRGLEPHKEDD